MDFGPNTFVVRLADGGGMAPAFQTGDFVYVDPDDLAEPGRFVGARGGRRDDRQAGLNGLIVW